MDVSSGNQSEPGVVYGIANQLLELQFGNDSEGADGNIDGNQHGDGHADGGVSGTAEPGGNGNSRRRLERDGFGFMDVRAPAVVDRQDARWRDVRRGRDGQLQDRGE